MSHTYVKMPRKYSCDTCGRENSVKVLPRKDPPPGVDAIGLSNCPTCKTQSIHFAGPEKEVTRFAQAFSAFQQEEGFETPLSIKTTRLR